jgi:hypothetical protein
MELYSEDGDMVGLREVCEWWVKTYPDDIFINEPKRVAEIRELAKEILERLGD